MKPAKESMSTARYPHLVGREELSDDCTLRFPQGVSRIGRWAPINQENGARVPHPAEVALERAQRKLDNLRAMLGPDFCREGNEGPWAA